MGIRTQPRPSSQPGGRQGPGYFSGGPMNLMGDPWGGQWKHRGGLQPGLAVFT